VRIELRPETKMLAQSTRFHSGTSLIVRALG